MSGYFRDGSKLGGFTTHPWMRNPSTDLYQISSAGETFLPKSTSSFTDVMYVGVRVAPGVRLNVTTSFGCDAVDIVPTAVPLEISATDRTFAPFVTCRGWPPA